MPLGLCLYQGAQWLWLLPSLGAIPSVAPGVWGSRVRSARTLWAFSYRLPPTLAGRPAARASGLFATVSSGTCSLLEHSGAHIQGQQGISPLQLCTQESGSACPKRSQVNLATPYQGTLALERSGPTGQWGRDNGEMGPKAPSWWACFVGSGLWSSPSWWLLIPCLPHQNAPSHCQASHRWPLSGSLTHCEGPHLTQLGALMSGKKTLPLQGSHGSGELAWCPREAHTSHFPLQLSEGGLHDPGDVSFN